MLLLIEAASTCLTFNFHRGSSFTRLKFKTKKFSREKIERNITVYNFSKLALTRNDRARRRFLVTCISLDTFYIENNRDIRLACSCDPHIKA